MACVLDRFLEAALCLCRNCGDAVRKDLTAIVQKTLEDTDIAIIEISDATKFERIDFLLRWVAAIVALVRISATPISAALSWTSALSRTLKTLLLLCHLSQLYYVFVRELRMPMRTKLRMKNAG